MINKYSIVKIIDNSGGISALIIDIKNKNKKGKIGDIVCCSIKKCNKNNLVKKGKIMKGVIIQNKNYHFNNDKIRIKFNNNYIILLNNKEEIIGKKIKCITPKILKNNQIEGIIKISKYSI